MQTIHLRDLYSSTKDKKEGERIHNSEIQDNPQEW